jgi:hypothetical protein
VSELPAVYDEASAALAPLAPKDLAVAHEIVATLRQTGDAYEVLARSLRQADPVAYARAKSVARARRDRLARLLDGILYSKS